MPKSIANYEKERYELVKKMLDILEVNESNNMLSLQKLDENQEKQNKILELVEEIKKYFICSKWSYFSNKKLDFKRNYLSLIKSVMKDIDVKMYSAFLHIKKDKKIVCETFYVFELPKNDYVNFAK